MKIINGASGGSGDVDGFHINGGPRRDTFDPALYEAAMMRERWADDSAQRAKSEPTSGEVGVSFLTAHRNKRLQLMPTRLFIGIASSPCRQPIPSSKWLESAHHGKCSA
jgi:hypothetical protein